MIDGKIIKFINFAVVSHFEMNTIVFIIGLVALLIGSFTDLKKREVPDWLNYGLIFTGLGLSLLFSIIYLDFWILLSSIIGLAAMFGLGSLMFYTGQWGGGDSKMIMGIGALIGIPISWPLGEIMSSLEQNIPFLFGFILYTFIAGAVYGLGWSIGLAIRHRKGFVAELKFLLDSKRSIKRKIVKAMFIFLILISLILFISAKYIILKILPLGLSLMVILAYYLYFFIKAIEISSMIQHVEPEELTEGDWINKDIVIDGKYISGPKDLGISKEQIKELIELKEKGWLNDEKGRQRLIEIKVGIPFVPSFLVGYLLSYYIGVGWVVGLL